MCGKTFLVLISSCSYVIISNIFEVAFCCRVVFYIVFCVSQKAGLLGTCKSYDWASGSMWWPLCALRNCAVKKC